MLTHLQALLFFSCYYFTQSAQPYFPEQIVFAIPEDQTLYAIDQVNQRAASTTITQQGFVFKHFPYAIPNSPQDTHYVQLMMNHQQSNCIYETYWEYGGGSLSLFPDHWRINETVYEITNFLEAQYEMIHSTNSSDAEDYWYSNKTCQVFTGQTYPCQEIYFKKNTDIPVRSKEVRRGRWYPEQFVTEYNVLSVGQIDEKYFNVSLKNWYAACQDASLGIDMDPSSLTLPLEQSASVQISLRAPTHKINGSDIVAIQWNLTQGCTDCLTWTPKQLIFNAENFQEHQNITFTRTKNGTVSNFHPIFNGGAYDFVPPEWYSLWIE